MANKVASKRWIYSNFSVGSSSNECATKTEILGFGLYITNDSSYASNQLVREEDIYLPTWTYTFSISNWDKNVGESGGTTSSISISSSKSRLGTTESVGWSIDSSTVPSWITWNSSSMTFTVASNSNTSSRTANIYFEQDESGKRDYARVTQDAKPAEDEYTFEIRKSNEEYTGKTSITFDVPASTVGWSGDYAYRSRKNGEQFANVSFSSDASWLHVDSSGSYTVYHNTGSSSRSGTITLTQAESGLKCYVYINQSGYTPTYTFNVSPTNLSVTAAETNETLTVNSYKTVLKSDGSETTESLDYEFSSDASWVNVARTTTNTTYITVAENLTVAERNAKITLTQAESGAQAFTNVIQAGKVQSSNKLTITSITYYDAYLFSPGVAPVVGPQMYLKFLLPSVFTWKTSSGITMNGGTAYAGDICNIYVFENSKYKLVRSFALQTGEQTITI